MISVLAIQPMTAKYNDYLKALRELGLDSNLLIGGLILATNNKSLFLFRLNEDRKDNEPFADTYTVVTSVEEMVKHIKS